MHSIRVTDPTSFAATRALRLFVAAVMITTLTVLAPVALAGSQEPGALADHQRDR